MIQQDVVRLTQELIAFQTESQNSNAAISDYLQHWLERRSFVIERLSYMDKGEEKVSLVAKLGSGSGGLGFFSHSDTVPGDPRLWQPWTPVVEQGRLIGRGSCDMKGPLAATIIAAAGINPSKLKKPIYIAITADEEQGHTGAHQVVDESAMLAAGWPEHAIVAEPTELRPVYAHKGGVRITVTAHGVAAHTSTDRGASANFLIAPFLAEMAALVPYFRNTERFKNYEFDPPTNGFNMVLDDGGCKSNVTAAKTVCTLSLRSMPNDHIDEQIALIVEKAKQHNLEVDTRSIEPFYISSDASIVQAACQATGITKAETVPFGTEAEAYQKRTQAMILGPGNIAQAHTIGEWIDIAQLQAAVRVYTRLIEQLCM